MRNIILIMLFCFFVLPGFAKATTASKYAESQYADKQGFNKVRINVKKEHTDKYQQIIREQIISAITYGYGDMRKYKDKKRNEKCRVSYIVLLDCYDNPVWSYIISTKQ